MKSDIAYIKKVVKLLGFLPQEGSKNAYYKVYLNHNNYIIKVDFDNHVIDYGEKIRKGDLTTSNFENSENFVVLECVNRILEKGYPPESISLEHKWPMGRKEKGKLDILITDEDNKAYLMIECKTWGVEYNKEKRKMQRDGGQLFSYYQQDKATQYLCLYTSRLTNGSVEYINDIVKVDEKWRELDNQREVFDHWNKNFKDNGIFDKWASPYGIEIKALTRGRLQELTEEDSGKIFNQFAEILRHNIVSDKPNAFNKMLNLFICKIIDEDKNDYEEVDFQWFEDDTHESLQMRLNDLYKEGMKRFLNIEVADYSNAQLEDRLYGINELEVREQIQEMFQELRLQKNPEFAFKEVYNEESFKENAVVVKEVVELLQPYQFRYGHKQQFLGDFFELLLNTSIKQESGQFFTPIPIAKFIVSCIPVKELMFKNIDENSADILPYAIDYATGSGHFLTEWMDLVQGIVDEFDVDKLRPSTKKTMKAWQEDPFKWAREYVYGIEADYRLVKTAKVSSFLNGDGEATIIRANGLDSFKHSTDFRGRLKEFNQEDIKLNEQFDVVIANPPYSVNAFRNTLSYGEESFELHERLSDESSEIECLFVERTMQLLKEGGVAGIILPSSILTNSGIYIDTREILLKYFNIKAIAELGQNTFMATGTNTVILFLERKSNNVWKKIEQGIKDFFDNPKESTINGIEEAFSKYVKNVYSGITLEDYITFINKNPNRQVKSHVLYNEYLKWFDDLTEIKHLKDKKGFKDKTENEQQAELKKLFYNKVFTREQDKMLYFFLTHQQQTVLIKVGEKQDEKDFIGYEFSNRRGYEGIRLYKDEDGKLSTKLYDEDNMLNPEKANYYVYKSFLNEYDVISDELADNVFITNLVDLMDFRQLNFLKKVNLNIGGDIKQNYKYDSVTIDSIAIEIINGKTPLKRESRYWDNANFPWLTIPDILDDTLLLSNTNKFVSETAIEDKKIRVVSPNSVLVSCTATIGKVCINTIPVTTNQQINAIVCDTDKVLPSYLGYYLQMYGYKLSYLANNSGVKHVNLQMLKNFQIPLPPISIQEKIVSDIKNLEKIYNENKNKIRELKSEIGNISFNVDSRTKLEEISLMIRRGKAAKYGNSNIQIIKSGQARGYSEFDFSRKHYVSDGFISDERNLQKGDILINSTGVGTAGRVTLFELDGDFVVDSHITIVRLDQSKAIPKYVLYALADIGFKTIEKMATGQSGQIELSLPTINNIKIGLPPMSEQHEIVSRIEKIEEEIVKIENQVNDFDINKKSIFNKYLE